MGDFPDLPAADVVVRILLLLWTGDYPAQCEVGKFIKCGKQACRRDKVTGDRYFTFSLSKKKNRLLLYSNKKWLPSYSNISSYYY